MVKDTLKKALEDAVGYYNNGMSANDAIVKSASDNDLTIDQTDRVVESFNTAKTINFFDKNASDRTGSFDLASKKDVTLALFGKDSTEKKASVHNLEPDVLSNSFYTDAPDKSANRKSIFAEKRAALLDAIATGVEEKWSHGYSDRTLHDMASDAYAVIKSAEADISDALGTIDSYLWTATEKIASGISKGAYDIPEDKANLFKVACPHKLVVDEVSKFCPLLKSASGGKYVKMNVVDTSLIDDLLKEADDIMYAVEQRKEYRKKQAEFQKKAEKLKSVIMSDPSMAQFAPDTSSRSLIHAPTMKKESSLLSMDAALGSLSDNESRKKVNEQIRDDARGALLADLLSSDPILQDADPRQVASIYKSLVATAPRVSLNKEVTRSVLRSAVNSIALSPADSKIFTDVDKGIQVAFGGLKDPKGDD